MINEYLEDRRNIRKLAFNVPKFARQYFNPQEIESEIALISLEKYPKYNPEKANLTTFLGRCVKNHFYAITKKERERTWRFKLAGDLEHLKEYFFYTTPQADTLAVKEYLSGLKGRDKKILERALHDRMEATEIADEICVTPPIVYTAIQRMSRDIRRILRDS